MSRLISLTGEPSGPRHHHCKSHMNHRREKAMKNLVGKWYSNHEPFWWLSFCEPDEAKPWWKFWRRAKEGEFLGVVIVQAPDIHEAVQVAWRKKDQPWRGSMRDANPEC